MIPDRGINFGSRSSQLNGRQARVPVQTWDQHPANSSGESTLKDLLAVIIKLVEIQVAMGIGKHNSDKDCENYNIYWSAVSPSAGMNSPICKMGLSLFNYFLSLLNTCNPQAVVQDRLDLIL